MTVDEFNISVDNFSDGIYRFILKNIKDEDKAKDIVQDSYEKLWRKFEEVSFSKVKSYLFSTAYHTMIDIIRREKKQVDFESVDTDRFYETGGYSDLKEVLDNAIQKLPEAQRSVVLLRDYEGYSYKEIADITNMNESQVKVYIYRARLFLKNYLKSADLVI